jgi:hypothetical protein
MNKSDRQASGYYYLEIASIILNSFSISPYLQDKSFTMVI